MSNALASRGVSKEKDECNTDDGFHAPTVGGG
jgi:hypothetical protein